VSVAAIIVHEAWTFQNLDQVNHALLQALVKLHPHPAPVGTGTGRDTIVLAPPATSHKAAETNSENSELPPSGHRYWLRPRQAPQPHPGSSPLPLEYGGEDSSDSEFCPDSEDMTDTEFAREES